MSDDSLVLYGPYIFGVFRIRVDSFCWNSSLVAAHTSDESTRLHRVEFLDSLFLQDTCILLLNCRMTSLKWVVATATAVVLSRSG